MDELRDTGAFDDALSDKDQIDRELEQGRSDREVEAELETLKTDVSGESADGGEETSVAQPETEAESEADADVDVADEAVDAELEELKDEES
jgi:phage shock protein A